MPANEWNPSKKLGDPEKKLTRREFLKSAGVVAGGAAIASLALASGCGVPATTDKDTSPGVAFTYVPPAVLPTLLDVPGCFTKVAADRLYSIEHIWVKSFPNDIAVIGVTDKLQALIANVTQIYFLPVGSTIAHGEGFGNLEGQKTNVQLISPVSGKVIQANTPLLDVDQSKPGPINVDPYGNGWMIAVRLSKPEELKELIAPEDYVKLTAKE